MADSPFISGARVAVTDYHGDGAREDFVEKAYKNGNFTLRGSKQQWKPWNSSFGNQKWSARQTGDGQRLSRRRLTIWDEDTDKEIVARVEATKARERWRSVRAKLDAVKEPTLALCEAVETALTHSSGIR